VKLPLKNASLWILFLSCDFIFILHVALMIFRLLLWSPVLKLFIGSGAPYCASDLRSRARFSHFAVILDFPRVWIPLFPFLRSLPTESLGRARTSLSWVFALVSVLTPRMFPHHHFFSADRDSIAFALPRVPTAAGHSRLLRLGSAPRFTRVLHPAVTPGHHTHFSSSRSTPHMSFLRFLI
jgi:hypothetical protein